MKTSARNRALVSGATSVFGLTNAYRDLRKARAKGDSLLVLDAVVSLLAVLTGIAVAVRALRRGEDDA